MDEENQAHSVKRFIDSINCDISNVKSMGVLWEGITRSKN